jgi:hypothetical protein
MTEKVPLKEVLAAVDLGARSLWDEIDDDQRKALKSEFFILTRYISSAKGTSRDVQEHFVLTVNEFFNKHWNTLQKHPKLLWQLLCMCSHESQRIMFHEWIGFKKKAGSSKATKLLAEIYPQKKMDEVEMLAVLLTTKEIKALAEEHGFDEKKLDKMFK